MRDDPTTLAALGAAAASLAAFAHETLGHGVACVATGGRIALLTSIYFRCLGGGPITDAAGPLGNLVAGLAAAMLLRSRKPSPALHLLLLLLAAFNLYWLGGQMIYAGILNMGDPEHIALALAWPESWRVIAVLIGCIVYFLCGKILVLPLRETITNGEAPFSLYRRIGIPHLSAIVSAALAGMFWLSNPWNSLALGILAIGVAPSALFVAVVRAQKLGAAAEFALPIQRSWGWIGFGFGISLIFIVVQGRGLGILARQ